MNLAQYLLDERKGDSLALITDEGNFTYAQVLERANQAANALQEMGVQPEQRVILALDDSIDYVAALFGALKLGAAVVMVNPDSDLQDMADYARAKVIINQPLSHPNGHFETFPSHRDDIAIWLFSGGTTGRPKAVLQSHGSFLNTTRLYAQDFLHYQENDRTLSVPKLYFGYATGSNLFFPFSVGATAILYKAKCTPEVLFQLIQQHRPTLLINVPTMVNLMLNHPDAGQHNLSCIRVVTSAGEALPESLYHKWKATFQTELLDGLGTAEMWHVFLSNRPGHVRPGSLGQAVPGFEVSVRDDDGIELPKGEVGRLWVAGDSRALCYWQQSELSQQALRGRYFAASDLVRQDDEGYFYYCGRADELLKVGGRWLAPQDVESCLLTHPAVKECAVVGQKHEDGLIRPHAFVVTDHPHEGLEDTLKAHVLQQLEPYKHPRSIIFVQNLPRTHLGKVNRKGLTQTPPNP